MVKLHSLVKEISCHQFISLVLKNVTGIMVDIMDLLESQLNFTVKHKFYEDFGTETEKGWDGVVGALVNKSVDLIAAELSITPERAKVSPTIIRIMIKST